MNEYTGTSLMMIGAIAALSFVIGSFFMRFWRVTGDRFFLLFGLSFWLEGTNRVLVGAMPAWRYQPATAELDVLVASLERYYSQNLIEVTNMIHASSRRHSRIKEFADAFKWGKKKP